ncbi:MAG: FAD binding domain-containing protein, partial [Firmicutes bacterium]|nr:FAD binding domain-containing protein [Bacillota bacterium]
MNSISYAKPKTKDEALGVLDEAGFRGRVAAGCTNVMPDIRAAKFSGGILVDISSLEELKGIRLDGDTVRMGALTTISEILDSEIITEHAPILKQAGRHFADPLSFERETCPL